jgi:hypothetical protein
VKNALLTGNKTANSPKVWTVTRSIEPMTVYPMNYASKASLSEVKIADHVFCHLKIMNRITSISTTATCERRLPDLDFPDPPVANALPDPTNAPAPTVLPVRLKDLALVKH